MVTVRQARPEDAEAMLERAASYQGCERLELTASKNAVPFYEQAGYERLGTVDHEPSGPHDVTLECVRMGKPL